MLAQFQSLYPTGSLTTELLKIHHGKYIVRSSVSIEGVTRATGMAAADTIEEAEDRSRARALIVLAMKGEQHRAEVQQQEVTASPNSSLGLASSSSLTTAKARVNERSTNSDSTEVTETSVSNASPASSTEVTETPVSNAPAASSTEVPETPVSNTPPADSTEVPETLVSNTPPIDSAEVTQTTDVSSIPEVFSVEDDSDIYSQDFDKPLPLPTYDEPELDAPVENTDIDSEEEPEEEPASSKATSASKSSNGRTTKKTTTKRKKKTEPIDLSDVIAKTDVEMERLNWTPQQGREYLINTYNKRGRTLLTEDELLDFLQHLESIPTQIELSEADPLAGF
ncbi:hypothetical protein [Calothrix sp. CCY 0018]|uniref:hypothetical protein n=1 Tax=Calothrix sp. CCY 0018 TaxID=3103864 RepID=UPI0039C6DA6F